MAITATETHISAYHHFNLTSWEKYKKLASESEITDILEDLLDNCNYNAASVICDCAINLYPTNEYFLEIKAIWRMSSKLIWMTSPNSLRDIKKPKLSFPAPGRGPTSSMPLKHYVKRSLRISADSIVCEKRVFSWVNVLLRQEAKNIKSQQLTKCL